MAKYVWEGKNRGGAKVSGEIDAPTEAFVRAYLRREQIAPISIKKRQGLNIDLASLRGDRKVSHKELAVFTRQFSTMIDAGLPLVQCLTILSDQQENASFKKILNKVKEDVEGGSTFADALGKHPRVFDPLFVNLVAAGEVGGILDTILLRLAEHIEKAMRLAKKIKGAMVYPATIVAIAVIVTVVLLVWVIPIFAQMFTDFGGQLPAPTAFVMKLSDITRKYFVIVLVAIFAAVMGFKWYVSRETGRKSWDWFLLKLPVVGSLLQRIAVARFSRTLGTMVSSGVPILEAMDIVSRTAGNKIIEEAIVRARGSISEGKTIAEPLEESAVFPTMVTQMVAVGEATGALDVMLNKIADFYDEEVDAAVEALTALLEPVLMVFLGVVVGGLVIAMYLPVFKLAGAIGG